MKAERLEGAIYRETEAFLAGNDTVAARKRQASLPVPGLRTPMRLTCFPELRPTVQTPSPCTTTFSEPGENRSTIPNAPIGASRIAVSGASAYSHGAPAGVACLESTLPCREGQNPGR